MEKPVKWRDQTLQIDLIVRTIEIETPEEVFEIMNTGEKINYRWLILDLSKMDSINSSGVGYILTIKRKMENRVLIIGIQHHVERTFRMLCINTYLHSYESEAAAMEYIRDRV